MKPSNIMTFVFIAIILTNPVLADPIVVEDEPFTAQILKFVVVFFLTVLLEFGIAYLFLRNSLNKLSPLLKSILIINAITFPITQILALFLMNFLNRIDWVLYIAEIVPFVGEFFLLKWQFNKLYNQNFLASKLSNKKILLINIAMNLLTFDIGIIFLQMI